jgi:hypothetical protein
MAKQKPKWTITVTRIGTKPPEVIEKVEIFDDWSPLAAEQHLSRVWNGPYCMQPGRFRAKLRDEAGGIVMTID